MCLRVLLGTALRFESNKRASKPALDVRPGDELDASTQQARKKINEINLSFSRGSAGGVLHNASGGWMPSRCKVLPCVPSAIWSATGRMTFAGVRQPFVVYRSRVRAFMRNEFD